MKINTKVQIVLTVLIGTGLLAGLFFTQTSQVYADALSNAQAEQAELQRQLKQLELEIQEQQKKLSQQKGKSASIQGEIAVLKSEIEATKGNISKKDALIGSLSNQIKNKSQKISELNNELGREQASLAKIFRQIDELDSMSLFEVVLSKQTLSDYFIDRDDFASIQAGLNDSFSTIRTIQNLTDIERETLELQKTKEADLKAELESDRKTVEQKQNQQQGLLAASKNNEKTYEQLIKEREAEAAQIRARLFELAGGAQGGGISFGDAVTYAAVAEKQTGVRSALILAILSQESDLGKNVGTCNRPGDKRTWKDIMPGPGQSWRDDQAAFLQITKELGINPDGQPLSCPLSTGGWGGAMGPSQFIPTTWLSVRGEVARLTGVALANPWNPRHAVMATAVYMRDLGAAAGGYTAERNAACKYYSGRACGQSSVPNTFYGDSVVKKADALQKDINFLNNK
jgi:membrane-bound lytic murein transglycosylase B